MKIQETKIIIASAVISIMAAAIFFVALRGNMSAKEIETVSQNVESIEAVKNSFRESSPMTYVHVENNYQPAKNTFSAREQDNLEKLIDKIIELSLDR